MLPLVSFARKVAGRFAPVTSGRFAIPAILVTFVVFRLALLCTSVHLGHFEEARQGNWAVMLLDGHRAGLEQARPFGFEGSSLLSAMLAVPLYWLFGPSGTILKLCLLGVSTLILGVIVTLARREEGPLAAWITGALFVFGPTMFVSYGFDTVGGAWWGCGLNALTLYAAIRGFRDRRREWIPVWTFLLALSPFFHPSCMVGAAYTIILMLANGRPAITVRIAAISLVTLAAGMIPMLLFGGVDDSGLEMVRQAFLERSYGDLKGRTEMAGPLIKAWWMMAYDLPHALCYRVLPHAGYLGAAVLAAVLVTTPVLLREDRGRFLDRVIPGRSEGSRPVSVVSIVVAFVGFYLLMYVISDITLPAHRQWVFYDKNYKVFFNILPFAFLAMGLLAARVSRTFSRARWPVLAVTGSLVALGLASGVSEMSDGSFSLASRYPSHDMRYLGRNLARSYDITGAIEGCRLHAGTDLAECLEGVGARAARHMDPATFPDGSAQDLADVTCAAFAPPDRPLCYRGVGWDMNWHGGIGRPARGLQWCADLAPFDDQCMRGFMILTPDVLFNIPDAWLERLISRLPADDRNALGPGFGVFLAQRFVRDPDLVLHRCEILESKHGLEGCRDSAARELGWLAGKTWEGGPSPDLPVEALESWSGGLGEMLAWRHHDRIQDALELCALLEASASCEAGVHRFSTLMQTSTDPPMLPAGRK
jgi:hypothetical protein